MSNHKSIGVYTPQQSFAKHYRAIIHHLQQQQILAWHSFRGKDHASLIVYKFIMKHKLKSVIKTYLSRGGTPPSLPFPWSWMSSR
jgi:hypothetical protein